MPLPQALEKIRAELIDSGRDTRYRLGAYAFVLNGLEFYLMKIGEKRHVTGQEFARGLMEFAVKQFGPFTRQVLEYWGIRATDDLGYIVYNLISINLMSKQDSDQLGDFFGVLDIAQYCRDEPPPALDREHIRSVRGA
jgi:uncharacterized repeat protein (TIGR04138 family)